MKSLKYLLVFFIFFGATLSSGDFLMPNEAFKPYVKLQQDSTIDVGVKLAKSIYLYASELHIEVVQPKSVSFEYLSKPKSVKLHGDDVYFNSADFKIRLKGNITQKVKSLKLKISYQGCSKKGLCYEPSSKTFTLKLLSVDIGKSKSDTIADTIRDGNLFIIVATFFGFGLLLAMTPCVFPMIPIISGLIVSQGKDVTTKRAFFLSVVYVFSMAVAYTIAGVVAGLFGSNLQVMLQAPWVVYSFAGVFVALAMSMFGFYELKLPDFIVKKVSSKQNSGGVIGVAIMGFLSALIVGPCVAAPLAGALIYIGQSGDAVLGGLALFSMSIGMGMPLIIVGVSAGKLMPRPGAWMMLVNTTFGVIMLGVAIWMLSKVVDDSVSLFLYALLTVGYSLHLGLFKKGVHIVQRVVAGAVMVGALMLFSELYTTTSSTIKHHHSRLNFHVVTNIDELNKLLEKNKGKKIMLDFSASWCVACKELDEETFSDDAVVEVLKNYVLIRADVTKNGKQEKALSKKYGVFGPPVLIFFDKNLKVIKSKTVVGFIKANKLCNIL